MQQDSPDWSPSLDPLELQPQQADIWRISLDLPTATVKLLESTLSEDEAKRAARFHFPADQNRYIVAHGCLRDILARYLKRKPEQLEFSANEYGKPALSDHELEFNLSHSGDFVLIAVTRGLKIGIDVERIRSDIEHEAIARRFFSPNEVAELIALPPIQREIAFYNCWTRKEAYIKAQGVGLSLSLDSFDVSLSPNQPALLRDTRPNSQEALGWALISLEVGSGYAAAVAIRERELKLRLWDWETIIR